MNVNVDGKKAAVKLLICVFVVDDHPMVKHGVVAMLGSESDMQCVDETGDGDEAVDTVPALHPQVVLMDMRMPRMDGIHALQMLQPLLPPLPLLPNTRFVLLASEQSREQHRALAASAADVLLKTTTQPEAVQAIRAAHEGHTVAAPSALPTALPARLRSQAALPPPLPVQSDAPVALGVSLTQHEQALLALLALLARGHSNQDICTALGIAMPTVKFHVTHSLGKLGADNRTEAVLVALRHKLVELQ